LGEDPRDLADAPDILAALGRREAEIGIEPLADIVAVEDRRLIPEFEELLLEHPREGRLAGSGKAGKPDDAAEVPVAGGARRARDGGGRAGQVAMPGRFGRIVEPRLDDAAGGDLAVAREDAPGEVMAARAVVERNRGAA